ncbi:MULTISPECIES: hypothetical protein [Streptomyces]|uniref:DNA-directed RNA polymerase specialized sigma24 family protein n=2 Tax=Streptomyces fradiae TaxID=1906 RepID=A0A1Y2P379_STRFR|nr:hypothetical protein K701_26355 [Streptomyces fradiae ATCC 10745 = DSM 40063]OSY53667.1 hypothetical protein BG846_00676 [Streptomyces fradiae ATCC 10745 = DSM 40063]
MSTQEAQHSVKTAESRAVAAAPVDVEQAEAALVEHYPRLVRIAYLVLPPSLGRNRRVLTAHALVQRSLPRRRTAVGDEAGMPAQRRRPEDAVDPGYAYVRGRVLRQALEAGLPLRRRAWPKRAQLPPLLPLVWGLRLFPRSGGAEELALDQRLADLSGAGRAAYVLRRLERQGDAEVRRMLVAAGASDPDGALAEADRLAADGPGGALLESPEFDPCSLQARPTDLMRRRQHTRAALAAGAALVVCGALLGLPGGGWGPDGAAAPPYARNPASEAALDPAKLRRVAPAAWQRSSRADFSVWPARGALVDDAALLRRALAVWARPGAQVRASATPGTLPGPPMGPPQLLYAGEVDGARVVLFHDGLRAVRYAEPVDGTEAAALDFARTDGADTAASAALVVGRTHANVRYLTAPWVRGVAVRDLLLPDAEARPLERNAAGVTAPSQTPAAASDCRSWDVLEVRDGDGTRVLTDLGEIVPVRLTSGAPGRPVDVAGEAARREWARTACMLPSMRAMGVRSVNSWRYAEQELPGTGTGTATWLCTRAETWRGPGSRVLAQFQPPAPDAAPGEPLTPGAVAARAEDSPACGPREPRVLAGVLWKDPAGRWYVLAAGSPGVASLATSGGVEGEADGRLLAVEAERGAKAELTGELEDGTRIDALR